ncbi:hypothetical protein ACFVZR_16585 [Streptomyces sp. NPDC058316]|uniref:hypothetical protein n=1 Tax=unclassified Streptomyces TaxID=2593676 RepID=UPI0033184179
MTGTGTPPGNPRSSEVRVQIPAASPADLRDAVREALAAAHTPPAPAGPATAQWQRTASGDWGLAAGGLRAELSVSWDGPELRIVGGVDAVGPAAITHLLADIARRLPGGPRHRTRHTPPVSSAGPDGGNVLLPRIPPPVPTVSAVHRLPSGLHTHELMRSPAAAAHLALHVLLRAPDMGPRADLAVLIDHDDAGAGTTAARPRPRLVADSLDIGPSVTAAETSAHRRPLGGPAPPRPAFVFDRTGRPAVPDGWLLGSWTCLAADAVHCSSSGAEGRHRLRAAAPRHLVRQSRLDLFVALWADTLTTLVAHPDRPLGSLGIPSGAVPWFSVQGADTSRTASAQF